jgi:DNA invertase Pin-like site-specific DNA recombinase
MLVGYARCSTDAQDLTAQRDALTALGPACAKRSSSICGTSGSIRLETFRIEISS